MKIFTYILALLVPCLALGSDVQIYKDQSTNELVQNLAIKPGKTLTNGGTITGSGAIGTTGVASFGVVKTPSVFPVEFYGAKGDGNVVHDAVFTASSPILTSATANFSSEDIGKSVALQVSTTSRQILTISGVISTMSCTLSSPASANSLPQSILYYGTDDTEAIQSAIDFASNAGGGVVEFSGKIYTIFGEVKDVLNSNSVLKIPYTLLPSAYRTITLQGVVPPAQGRAGLSVSPNAPNGQYPDQYGTVLYCPTTVTTSGVAGGYPAFLAERAYNASTFSFDTSSTVMAVKNITIVLKACPTLTAIQGAKAGGVLVDQVRISVDYWPGNMPDPTSGAATGIMLPQQNNYYTSSVYRTSICGFYKGIELGEHGNINETITSFCIHGISASQSGHPCYVGQWIPEECAYNLSTGDQLTPGKVNIIVDDAEMENATVGGVYPTMTWSHQIASINDPSNRLHGQMNYAVGWAGASGTTTISGAQNLSLYNIDLNKYTLSGSLYGKGGAHIIPKSYLSGLSLHSGTSDTQGAFLYDQSGTLIFGLTSSVSTNSVIFQATGTTGNFLVRNYSGPLGLGGYNSTAISLSTSSATLSGTLYHSGANALVLDLYPGYANQTYIDGGRRETSSSDFFWYYKSSYSATYSGATLLARVTTLGSLILPTAGGGIQLKEGSSATMGITTLSSGVSTVTTSAAFPNSRIVLTNVYNGTVANIGFPAYSTTTGSFTITSSNLLGNNSVTWQIFNPAP